MKTTNNKCLKKNEFKTGITAVVQIRIILYYHNDHLGSTSVVTNSSGGIVEETFYAPYGEILEGGQVGRFTYEGREFSELAGDYDFRFRKYDPELGIFTQPDALIPNVYDPQELNRYAFERRNPYKYVDEDGKTFVNPSDMFGLDTFKYGWKFGRPEPFYKLGQDLSTIWGSNEFRYVRGAWSATGDPYYRVLSESVGLMVYMGYGEDHLFASKDPANSIKEIIFAGSSIGLMIGGFFSSGKIVQSLSYSDTFSSFYTGAGLVENTFNSMSGGGGSSVKIDNSKTVSTEVRSSSQGGLKASTVNSSSWYTGIKNTASSILKKAKSWFGGLFGR